MTHPQQPWSPDAEGPPPPTKRKTGGIVAIVLGAVVVLGITGFVTPGFFLSDGHTDADSLVAQLVTDMNGRDRDALNELACADAEPAVEEAVREIGLVLDADLSDIREISDDEVRAEIKVRVGDVMRSIEVLVIKTDGYWCWQDMKLLPEADSSTV